MTSCPESSGGSWGAGQRRTYIRQLVRPSRVAQPYPQIIEHFIRDMNPKWFHCNNSLLVVASGEPMRCVV